MTGLQWGRAPLRRPVIICLRTQQSRCSNQRGQTVSWRGAPMRRTLRTFHLGRRSPKEGKNCSFKRARSKAHKVLVFSHPKKDHLGFTFLWYGKKKTDSSGKRGRDEPQNPRWEASFPHPGVVPWKILPPPRQIWLLGTRARPPAHTVHISEPLLRVKHCFPNVLSPVLTATGKGRSCHLPVHGQGHWNSEG